MAYAESKIITEEQIVEVEVDREYALTLTKAEARALASVLVRVGGPGDGHPSRLSARSLTDSVLRALAGAGAHPVSEEAPGFGIEEAGNLNVGTERFINSIYFEGVPAGAFDQTVGEL